MKSIYIFAFYTFLISWFIPTEALGDVIVVDGIKYRSAAEICSKLGMKMISSEDGKVTTLSSKWSELKLIRGSRLASLNEIKLYFGFPTIVRKKSLYIPELDWQFTISPLLIPPKTNKSQRTIRTIIIDPGHGGRDPGAQNISAKLAEKDLTLQVAKQLAKILKKEGYRVHLTRTKDKFIELGDRPAFARKKKADLFISIHFNSASTSTAAGIETFAYTLLNQPSTGRSEVLLGDKVFRRANRNDSFNVLLAYYMQKHLIKKSKDVDRGVKRARFTVLEQLNCPGVLLELGFMNNPQTAKKLKKTNYLDNLAASIRDALIEYHKRLDPKK